MSHYPSDDDVRMIGYAIAHDEQVIAALNSEMNMIAAQLEQLRRRKIKYQDNIRKYRSLITLARRIPHDVLADIFELCAESGWTRAPLVASHVCSTWRKAAEYPRVWSRIYIDCGLGNPLVKTKLWLSRAQQSPLHITLDVPTGALSMGEILAILFEHSTQWRSVTIRTHDSVQLNHILSLMHHPFPQLCRLDCVTHCDTHTANLVDFSAVRNAPLLSQLNVRQPNLPRWNIPFQLTNLRLVLSTSRIPTDLVLASRWTSMLANLLGLKQLSLELTADWEYHYELDTMNVVELPQLESLVLMVTHEFLGVFNNMQAPMLRKLFLRCSSGDELISISPGPIIRRFLESSSRIELLELHDVDLSREELVQCFTLLPRLEEFRLHDNDISDDELQLLYGSGGLCANLTRLDVRWCAHLTGSALVQLVKSRIRIDGEKGKPVEPTLKAMVEVAAINCLHVKELDVLDLAEYTTCRLMLRASDDFCRNRDCCTNDRYRRRMRLRHNIGFQERNPVLARIIL